MAFEKELSEIESESNALREKTENLRRRMMDHFCGRVIDYDDRECVIVSLYIGNFENRFSALGINKNNRSIITDKVYYPSIGKCRVSKNRPFHRFITLRNGRAQQYRRLLHGSSPYGGAWV